MYDRAPRTLTRPHGQTVEHVGPGTYEAGNANTKNLRADGYAPFLSMTSRDSFLNPTDTVIAAPGPGQYDPVNQQQYVKGGRIMSNKANRFSEVTLSQVDTPGPGSYNLSNKTASAPHEASPAQPTTKNINVNRLKFQRQPIAPSIPTPGQAYGYEENDDGTLRKQDAPNKDGTMGPAYYDVDSNNSPNTSKKYKGIHFGKLTSGRMNFSGKDGPGPGEYEPFTKEGPAAENLNIHNVDRTKFDAKLPRYHELVVKEEEKKAVPGPGKYEVRGIFDVEPPKVNTEGIEVEHPPFGSQAKRFVNGRKEVPAPGSYNDPRVALDSLKRVTGLKRSPFGQTSLRFKPHSAGKLNPGPGSYNVGGMSSDSMRKAYIESTRRGVFGTTSVRIAPMMKNEPEVPGPAHYQVQEKPFQPRYKQLSSNFASLSNRLVQPPSTVKDLPPPGSYEVHESFMKTQEKMSPAKPRNISAKRKQGAFQSSASRFAPPRDVIIAETDPAYPGPGAYDARLKDNKGNPMITKDKRFKEKPRDDLPGPGAYQFSPLIQDTVLKGTFNATLNNPIAPRLDNLGVPNTNTNHPFLLGV